MQVGYARVSSTGQSLEVQRDLLAGAGCEKVFAEKVSGTSMAGRTELADAMDFCREGDTFVVTRLDRCARSAKDLHNIVAALSSKGVGFRCLQQGGLDTTTSHGKLMLGILAAVAEFETDIRKERQMEGIEKAKAQGRYRGRPAAIDAEEVRKLRDSGMGASQIAQELKIGRASVYRVLEDRQAESRVAT
jgi:DNA invertase Pin-like site-specific DNA recombinase